jgi:hypothetical protein
MNPIFKSVCPIVFAYAIGSYYLTSENYGPELHCEQEYITQDFRIGITQVVITGATGAYLINTNDINQS